MGLSTTERKRLDELRIKYSNERLEMAELLELSGLQEQELADLGLVTTKIK